MAKKKNIPLPHVPFVPPTPVEDKPEEILKTVYISAEEADRGAVCVKCPHCGIPLALKTDYEKTDEGEIIFARPVRKCGRGIMDQKGCEKPFHFKIAGPIDLAAKRFKDAEMNEEDIPDYVCSFTEEEMA